MKFILLTSSILGIATCSAMPYTIQGVVYSSDNNPMTGCSVVLFSIGNDSLPVTGTSCNEQGAFSLQAEQGEYRLRASLIGMSPVSRPLLLDRDLTCDTIWMEPDAVMKEEVTVTAKFIEHRADRFIVKIAGNPLVKNTNGMDMLYRIPGTWGAERLWAKHYQGVCQRPRAALAYRPDSVVSASTRCKRHRKL